MESRHRWSLDQPLRVERLKDLASYWAVWFKNQLMKNSTYFGWST